MITSQQLIAAGTVLTGLTLIPLVWQLRASRKQAKVEFEDRLVDRYREILKDLPVESLCGQPCAPPIVQAHLGAFYRYFDLCNEQVFLRANDRVSPDSWKDWAEGMKVTLERPAFRAAWELIGHRTASPAPEQSFFNGLRYLLQGQHFDDDPRDDWPSTWPKQAVNAPELTTPESRRKTP